MTWHSDIDVQADRTLHVWPDGDLVEHELDGAGCPCGPRLEEESGSVLVIHHALDGRERHEH